MPLFKMDATYGAYPQMLTIAGQFTVPATPAINQQILPVDNALPNSGAAQGFYSSISPKGLRVNVFHRINYGQPVPASNISPLPPNVPLNVVANLGEFVLDCSGFSAELVSATANLIPQQRGQTIAQQADVTGTDPLNKLVFVQIYTQSTGAPVAPVACNIAFQIVLKDSIGV